MKVDNLTDFLRALQEAAQSGDWSQIPIEDQTAELASVRLLTDGSTALHLAARAGHIMRVPESMLSREALLQKDTSGQDPFGIALKLWWHRKGPEQDGDLLTRLGNIIRGNQVLQELQDRGLCPAPLDFSI